MKKGLRKPIVNTINQKLAELLPNFVPAEKGLKQYFPTDLPYVYPVSDHLCLHLIFDFNDREDSIATLVGWSPKKVFPSPVDRNFLPLRQIDTSAPRPAAILWLSDFAGDREVCCHFSTPDVILLSRSVLGECADGLLNIPGILPNELGIEEKSGMFVSHIVNRVNTYFLPFVEKHVLPRSFGWN